MKRGDTSIKRGQVIAKSGGIREGWGSPQLHFEIRRGSTPVDPLRIPQRGVRRGVAWPHSPILPCDSILRPSIQAVACSRIADPSIDGG